MQLVVTNFGMIARTLVQGKSRRNQENSTQLVATNFSPIARTLVQGKSRR